MATCEEIWGESKIGWINGMAGWVGKQGQEKFQLNKKNWEEKW